ncbi:MAG: peptide ABC transporter substrate-binding protein [Patescibacteria group bacterium]|nr:peptide ABC transporter substrate-binding protein [Patescibacteria group bacterium]MDE2438203.1 peptide ABC transporter substrate-binding protein [Patescibacteria group bacterium]
MKHHKYFSLHYWKQYYQRLETRDKHIAQAGALLAAVSFVILILVSFFIGTVHPTHGGEFKEGLVGTSLLKLNPLLATSENENDLISLVYRGLFKVDSAGTIVPDLAASYETQNNGAVWIITLKNNLTWQDGTPLTADDVVFTVNLIHTLENKTPLQYGWQGVMVEKISDRKIKFSIPNPYAFFLTNLELKIIPKHIFEHVPVDNLALSPYNVKPIGDGPYMVDTVTTKDDGHISSYSLVRSPSYAEKSPYIDRITFSFYETKTDALEALTLHRIDALANIDPQQAKSLSASYQILHIARPLYYAAFLNAQNNPVLGDDVVRESLKLSTPQQELINTVFLGYASPLSSPLPPPIIPGVASEYNPQRAKELLTKDGWVLNANGLLIKKNKPNEPITLTIVTPQNSFLIETASILAKSWREIGIDTKVEIVPLTDLETNYIEPRKYDVLLFGNILDLQADPFSFWHSSQKFNPGRNLSLYQNKKVDTLTETIRETMDPVTRNNLYTQFAEIIQNDNPVIFLYDPDFLYAVSKRVKNVTEHVVTNQSDRFASLADWYITSLRSL